MTHVLHALLCIVAFALSLGAGRVILVPVDGMIRRGWNGWIVTAAAMSLIAAWMSFVFIAASYLGID